VEFAAGVTDAAADSAAAMELVAVVRDAVAAVEEVGEVAEAAEVDGVSKRGKLWRLGI